MKILSTSIFNVQSVAPIIIDAARTKYFQIKDSRFFQITTGIIEISQTKLLIENSLFNASSIFGADGTPLRSRGLSAS